MEVKAGENFRKEIGKAQRVCLDSSIFIYHLENISPYNILTSILIEEIAEGNVFCNIPVLVITELLTRPFKNKDFNLITIFEEFIKSLPNSMIFDINFSIARLAAKIRAEKNLKTPDAILIATSLASSSDYFITDDLSLKNIIIKDLSVLVLEEFL